MIFVKLDSLSTTACRGGAKTGSYALLEGSRSRSNLKSAALPKGRTADFYYHLLNSESSSPSLFSRAKFTAQVPGKISRLLPLTSTTRRVSPERVRFLGSPGHFSMYLI